MMQSDDIQQGRPVGALVQALRILRYLSGHGAPEGVSTIARATGVNGSTCFNLLRTMVAEGLVVFDQATKTYRPGLGLVELAIGVLGTNPSDLIRPEMERLALAHGALICLWHITESDRIVLIDSAFDPTSTRVHLPQGKRLPALIGGLGRVVAARRGIPKEDLRRHFAQFRWQSAPRFEDYWNDIEQARKTGYGLDCGQLYVGVDVVAAVIADHTGTPLYGLSSVTLSGQTTPETRSTIGTDLAECCDRLSRALFAHHPEAIRDHDTHSAS